MSLKSVEYPTVPRRGAALGPVTLGNVALANVPLSLPVDAENVSWSCAFATGSSALNNIVVKRTLTPATSADDDARLRLRVWGAICDTMTLRCAGEM